MKFNETLMYRVFDELGDWLVLNSWYTVLLGLPFVLLVVVFGVLLALIVDTIASVKEFLQ